MGWRLKELRDLIARLDLYVVDCDGCAFGIQSAMGSPSSSNGESSPIAGDSPKRWVVNMQI